MADSFLAEIAAKLGGLPKLDKDALATMVVERTGRARFVPNYGPQTLAYLSEADELFYGGQAGGGKSFLLVGLALTSHQRSLVLRRTNKEAQKLVEEFEKVIDSRDGWNGQEGTWRIDGRVIDIGGCQLEDDKQKRKGIPHDLKAFDEVTDFTESQYVFIIAWCRSADPKQRCRVVACGNPPTRPEGLWVLKRWGAWLDPKHPNPAKEGELRWYTTGDDDRDVEVDGPGPHLIKGEFVRARSRTFIRAKLSDNPDLAETDYDSVLAALPAELRAAYREGRFDLSLKDDPWQLIPTSWVREAMDRWTDKPPEHSPMCAVGVDVARGGSAQTILAARYDAWYAPILAVPGSRTPLGTDVAGLVVANRRNNATIVIDMGGGYGGAPYEHLKANGIEVVGHNGAMTSVAKSQDRKLGFTNRRSEVWWKFREALDPSQPQGSPVCLPPDSELMADLTAPTFAHGPRGITVEPKEKLTDRLGRSPDKGDAVVMCWSAGAHVATHGEIWRKAIKSQNRPRVNRGHEAQRRRR